MSGQLSPNSVPAPKQLKYTAGIANGLVKESTTFLNQNQKVCFLILFFFAYVSTHLFTLCCISNVSYQSKSLIKTTW
ncbi:hypothetical protein HanLR1_Chr14g0531471 [Helianthus annuus]|nr:hypothetical protein HanHA89_Chr14g0569091 [Helianthus annuus]KAJ0656056.1 hypothetical protein HanLR1_Chr14g0531471 [Helianthus annuus]